METSFRNVPFRHRCAAFTLIELLVSMSVLTLLILLVSQLVNSAAIVTISSNKHMDSDGQARSLLDRMAIDFALMVKRDDVDYFIKQPGIPQLGNDQIAFFSEVSGYSSGSPSPVSLVAYRVNSSDFQVERFGKGLLWNGASDAEHPLVFSSSPQTIANTWPAATDPTTTDTDNYEPIGPQVFRFEYYYVLKNGTCSTTPWDPSTGSIGISGFRDVTAIAVTIAVIDAKSRVLVTNNQFTDLLTAMEDFADGMVPGALETQWQDAINRSIENRTMQRLAASSIRVYSRFFYLATTSQ